jgi:transcriptional regulator with XRE-family HTH domain
VSWQDGPARGLGARLRDARQRRNLTQQQLATRADIKLDTLRSIEQGRTANPGVFTLLRLAEELGVTLDALVRDPHPTKG